MFFDASVSPESRRTPYISRYVIPAVAVCLLMLLSACNGDDPVSPDPDPDPPSVVSEIDDQEMKADDEPATFDLEAVFDDPSGEGLTYEAESTDADVVAAAVEAATLTVTPVHGGEAFITVTAENEGGTAETDFDVVIILPDAPDRPED